MDAPISDANPPDPEAIEPEAPASQERPEPPSPDFRGKGDDAAEFDPSSRGNESGEVQ
jgi:hypothetical protein